jgi:hypothetical protein
MNQLQNRPQFDAVQWVGPEFWAFLSGGRINAGSSDPASSEPKLEMKPLCVWKLSGAMTAGT